MARSKKTETRMERWLTELAQHLGDKGWQTRLTYDDAFRGDELAMGTWRSAGVFVELQLRRSATGAALELFADSAPGLAAFEAGIAGLHRSIRRRDNAKRKFFHRIERMASRLSETFEARVAGFPLEAFDRLSGALPATRPMIGVGGSFRLRDQTSGPSRKKLRHPSHYAASVDVEGHRRAVRYLPEQGFFFAGDAEHALRALLRARPSLREEEHAIANRVDRDGPNKWDEAQETIVEVAGEALSFADYDVCGWDCDFVDLPDCDVCDLPDCVL